LADVFDEELLVCRETFCIKHRRVFLSRASSSASPWTPTIIVDGALAASRTSPNREICHPPSPAKTMDSGEVGGTYTVTWRPPSYSNVSVTSCPAVGDIGVGSLLVAATR
jgi:hypothetical protein